MKIQFRKAAVLALVLNIGSACAATINFDDIYVAPPTPDPAGTQYHGSFPAQGYMGLNWSGREGQWSWVVSSGPSTFDGTVAISGDQYAWSNGGAWLQVTSADGGTFNFNSFFARIARRSDQEIATVKAFLGDREIASQTISLTTEYSHYNFHMRNVYRITIDTYDQNILFDNIVVNQVPEPSSIALMGLAAAGLAFSRRRKA